MTNESNTIGLVMLDVTDEVQEIIIVDLRLLKKTLETVGRIIEIFDPSGEKKNYITLAKIKSGDRESLGIRAAKGKTEIWSAVAPIDPDYL